MEQTRNRRDFLKLGAAAFLAAKQRATAEPAVDLPAKTVLKPFHYTGVRLRDGMLRRQFLHVRNIHRDIGG